MHCCIAKLYCCSVASAGDPQFMHGSRVVAGWLATDREHRRRRERTRTPQAAPFPPAPRALAPPRTLPVQPQRTGCRLPRHASSRRSRAMEAAAAEGWGREREIKFCSLRLQPACYIVGHRYMGHIGLVVPKTNSNWAEIERPVWAFIGPRR